MAFHGFLDVPAVEIALEGQQREIHCVDGKDIAMDAFIIPRRARTVISVIMPLVVRIAFEGVGIVVESLTHAVGAGRASLTARRNSFRKGCCINARFFRHDID